nr:SDR family oxidoreductase [Kitasatospora purpeofusca]
MITGAGAGVGRARAVAFAARGERLALIARGRAGLEAAVHEAEQAGAAQVIVIEADVADALAVKAAAARAEEELGPIDVWVNDAFASVFAPFAEISPEEFRRITEVGRPGYVYATRAALDRMLPRDRGVVVQVGSAIADRGIPLQSAHSGAKHAIQGSNEALRCELLASGTRVRTTMVQIPAVNTPQFDWVCCRLPNRAQPVPPIYQPQVAARAVLFAADHPGRREYWVGASTVATLLANAIVTRLLDRYLARTGFDSQQKDPRRSADDPDNLFEQVDRTRDFGSHGRFDDRASGRGRQQQVAHALGPGRRGAARARPGGGAFARRRCRVPFMDAGQTCRIRRTGKGGCDHASRIEPQAGAAVRAHQGQ